MGHRLQAGKLNLPDPCPMPNDPTGAPQPHVFVGDEAFPLGTQLLRPYPGRGLTKDKRIFNYRLSRARRVVECSFGILSQRWRIYHRKINMLPENVVRVVKATVVLHNMLQQTYPLQPANSEEFDVPKQLTPLSLSHRRGASNRVGDGVKVRDSFRDYFCSPRGAVEWQNRSISYC